MLNIKKPRKISCAITETGIQIGSVLYPYKNIKNFALIGNTDSRKLVFETERFFMPHHYVLVPGEFSDDLENLLRDYIKYDESIQEPAAHKIMDKLGI